MGQLSLGVVATSRKHDERRLAIHPGHVERIDAELRRRMFLEQGYGERFGVSDAQLAPLVGGPRSRDELLGGLRRRAAAQAGAGGSRSAAPRARSSGAGRTASRTGEITQLAIDRRLTLIAWEAMNHWTADGNFSVHVFHKNNELAGYCSVLHALELLGSTGDYGRRLRGAVISFGATARGAVRGLSALGISDVTVLTQRSVSAVASPFASVRMRRFVRDPANPSRTLALERARPGPIARGPGTARHRRQLHPAGHRRAADVRDERGPQRLQARHACSSTSPATRAWAFEWARPTSFADPMFTVGQGLHYYAVDHSPSFLWNSATWENSEALLELPAGRHGRARGVGGRRDDPPRDRDPRGPGREPADPVFPGPFDGLSVQARLVMMRAANGRSPALAGLS